MILIDKVTNIGSIPHVEEGHFRELGGGGGCNSCMIYWSLYFNKFLLEPNNNKENSPGKLTLIILGRT